MVLVPHITNKTILLKLNWELKILSKFLKISFLFWHKQTYFSKKAEYLLK